MASCGSRPLAWNSGSWTASRGAAAEWLTVSQWALPRSSAQLQPFLRARSLLRPPCAHAPRRAPLPCAGREPDPLPATHRGAGGMPKKSGGLDARRKPRIQFSENSEVPKESLRMTKAEQETILRWSADEDTVSV